MVFDPSITLYEFIPADGIRFDPERMLNRNIQHSIKGFQINIWGKLLDKETSGADDPCLMQLHVGLRKILDSPEWIHTRAGFPLMLGSDVFGKPVISDLKKDSHLLITGIGGISKTVCVNSILASLSYRLTPREVRFILGDPEMLEIREWSNIRTYMLTPVIMDLKKVIRVMELLAKEIEGRRKLFKAVGVCNITDYNKCVAKLKRKRRKYIAKKLYHIIFILNGLNDLISSTKKEVEDLILRIIRPAQDVGIYCVLME